VDLENKIGDSFNELIRKFMEKSDFFRAWKKGPIDRSRAEKFLVSFDFLVKGFPALIAAGAARAEDEETRRILAVNLYQECGEGVPQRTHHAIFRKFLATAGVQGSLAPEGDVTRDWRSGLLEIVQGADCTTLLGALSAGEYLSQPALTEIFSALQPLFPGADAEYFTSHLETETEHVKEITSAVARQPGGEDPWKEAVLGFKLGLSVWEDYFNRLTPLVFGPEAGSAPSRGLRSAGAGELSRRGEAV